MTFTEHENGEITLQMQREDYELLMHLLGLAIGAMTARDSSHERFQKLIRFVDELNNGNRNYVPYTTAAAE